MLNKILLTFILITCIFDCQAQLSNSTFIGSIMLEDKRSYTYKLHFEADSPSLVGYTVTDLQGALETKSRIKGRYNSKKKQITYEETAIIKSKAKIGPDDFCLVHTQLKLGKKLGMPTLRGSFTGYKTDGTTVCAKGKIALIGEEALQKKLEALVPKDSSIKSMFKESPSEVVAIPTKEFVPHLRKLSPGASTDINTDASYATVEIWDSEANDGDIISISCNQELILNKYSITTTPKVLKINLKEGLNTLTLKAIDEGKEPPNTAKLKITLNNETYSINAATTIAKPVEILLHRMDK